MLNDYDDELTLTEYSSYGIQPKDTSTLCGRYKEPAYINLRDADGLTCLHRAAMTGEWALLPVLLRAGADVHALTPEGESALHLAARQGSKLAYRLLIQGGADPTLRNRQGETPEALLYVEH
ncbi:ankyrin repeat domain-containing protein [Parachitinimonas caeni]|uniref:Ankyrin repeat domain-containing protein n=1 Tax=Parachitinimonas caeni TaxID=3031301 RepID=A0ABT7DZ69_9NEIS|nr:ankyrin repeat domain-containing protein [Parachitinimonas caeni]MDK2125358.1 ankyrin repeat domain-containing protein [Parachitinimonas caeni]